MAQQTIQGYPLSVSHTEDAEIHKYIIAKYRAFNYSKVPQYYDVETVVNDRRTVDYVLRNDAGEIIGGLLAELYWRSLYVAYLWLDDSLRQGGIGTTLMNLAEAEARRQQCDFMWLTTYSFQARGFYEKLGFRIVGQMDGHPPGYSLYTMRKDLE